MPLNRSLPALVGLLLCAPLDARAASEDTVEFLYERAVTASQEGRNEVAAALFDEALTQLPEGHSLRGLALYGAARTQQRLGTPASACAAVKHYQTFIGRADAEAEKRTKAAAALPTLIEQCRGSGAAAAPAVSPTPTAQTAAPESPAPASPARLTASAEVPPAGPDRTWAWVATGGSVIGLAAGGALLSVASGHLDDANAADKRFLASGRTSQRDLEARDAADDSARSAALAGYATLGVGAAVGGVALWLWLREPGASEAGGVTVAPTPSGFALGGRF
jgi:hypothetical protein